MKHIHLDLHVNMHVIGTVIVSSLTVASLAALEYVHLNSALAYEKKAIYAQFQNNNTTNEIKKEEKIAKTTKSKWKAGSYSDEAVLNSAEEFSLKTLMGKTRMKRTLVKMVKNNDSKAIISIVKNLSTEQKMIVLERIEEKIEAAQSETVVNEKRIGYLLAAKELFMGQ